MRMLIYKFFRFWVRLFTVKYTLEGVENLPKDACIVVGNHAQMSAPIGNMLYYPRPKRVWCIGEMMHFKEVPAYAFADFWSQKPKYIRWFFKISSYLIAPLAVIIFNSADTIGVYKDKRMTQTFKESVAALKRGEDVIIFPEEHKPHNNIVYEFQIGFVDVARLYHKDTGANVSFVPQYVAPDLKKIYFGEPVVYDDTAPAKAERVRISEEMQRRITELARSLPEHTVIPYENIPKSQYPKNTDYDLTKCSEAAEEK